MKSQRHIWCRSFCNVKRVFYLLPLIVYTFGFCSFLHFSTPRTVDFPGVGWHFPSTVCGEMQHLNLRIPPCILRILGLSLIHPPSGLIDRTTPQDWASPPHRTGHARRTILKMANEGTRAFCGFHVVSWNFFLIIRAWVGTIPAGKGVVTTDTAEKGRKRKVLGKEMILTMGGIPVLALLFVYWQDFGWRKTVPHTMRGRGSSMNVCWAWGAL